MGNIKETNISNRTYYFYDDMINFEYFDSGSLEIDQNPCNNIGNYDIGHVTKYDSKYLNTHSVNPLYLTVDKADGFVEGKEGSKYLSFVFGDKSKEVLKNYAELWSEIKNLVDMVKR